LAEDEAGPEVAAAAEAEEDEADAGELEELDEQPATARTDRATAPDSPAIRRVRVRRAVLFMILSLRSRSVAKVSPGWPAGEPIVTTWK
jgi:hypothetical protein